jgi:RimJ/RimL family protein N-acetyltransferase
MPTGAPAAPEAAPLLSGRRIALWPIASPARIAIALLHIDPRVTGLLVDGIPDTPLKADAMLRWNAPLAQRGIGTFAIRRHDDPALLGLASLTPYGDAGDVLELGARLSPRAWGGGIGLEAAALLVAHAFGAMAHGRLVTAIDPRNRPARFGALRLGFRPDGHDILFGHPVERLRLDRADWRGIRPPRQAGPMASAPGYASANRID